MSGTYKFGFASSSGTGGSASVDWGDIGGTLSDQTDLNLALGAKQDVLLTGLTPATGLVADTDTVLQAFGKLENFARYATVAEAEAATGRTGAVVFVHETEKWYKYHATCALARDGDLILNTAAGGTTRWESMELSHKMGETGWVNTDGATITALDSTTVRLTLSSAAVYAIKGVRYELAAGNYDIVLSGAATPKFIGVNAAGALYHQDTLWDFETQCPVALAYWTGTAIAAAPQTEFHGLRDSVWHLYTHNYVGLQYKSGLTFTGNVQTDNNTNPGVDTVQYLWSTTGVVQDEDVQSTPGAGQWLQTLGSGLTSATAGIFPFFYFNGTFVTTLAAMADRAPFIYSGANGTPRWNNAGTLTDSVTGDYVVYHYFATPMVGGWSVFARPHNAVYTSLATALQARPSQLTWSNYAELKHLYTAIWRVNTGWTTVTHRCKLVSLQDFRTVAGGPVAATSATDHNALSNRGATFSHPAAAIYGTRDGGVQFHNTATNGLLSSDSLIWDNVNGILKTTKLELSSAVIKPLADSTTALQVTKADGTTVVATFDTTNSRVGIGTAAPQDLLHVAKDSRLSVYLVSHEDSADPTNLLLRKTRGTQSTPLVVQDGDSLGSLSFQGYSALAGFSRTACSIVGVVDGEPDSGGDSSDMPGRLVFNTVPNGSSTLTERMRITNAGRVGIGTNTPTCILNAYTTSALVAEFATNSTDATVVFLKNTDTGSKNWGLGVAGSSNLGGAGSVGNFYIRNETDGAVRLLITPAGAVGIGAGSVSAPALYLNADTNTGWYHVGSDNWGFSANGAKIIDVSTLGIEVSAGVASSKVSVRFNSSNQPVNLSYLCGNGNPYIGFNTIQDVSADTQVYDRNGRASRIAHGIGSSALTLSVAASGTAGNAITWISAIDIAPTGGVVIGPSGFTGTHGFNATAINIATAKTPASASAAGTAGDICWDTSYVYVCVSSSTWKRAALSTW